MMNLLLLLAGCAGFGGLVGCENQADDDAQANASLAVYSAGPRGLAETICDLFTDQTGIPTQLYTATTGQVMAKLESERHNPRADVVILASRTAMESLKQADQLRAIDVPVNGPTHEQWHDPDGTYWATAAAAVGIATMRERYDPAMDWSDVFTGELAGPTIMPSPTRSGSAADFLIAYTQQDSASRWASLERAKAGGMDIAGANSQAITNLLTGSHEMIVAAVDYLIFQRIEDGEPIVMHFPSSGVPVIPRPAAVLDSSSNVESAVQFIAFYLSTAAQEQVAAVHMLPVRSDVAVSDVRQTVSSPREMPLDIELAVKQQAEVLQRFRQELE